MTVGHLLFGVVFMGVVLAVGNIGPLNLVTVAVAAIVATPATFLARLVIKRVYGKDIVYMKLL